MGMLLRASCVLASQGLQSGSLVALWAHCKTVFFILCLFRHKVKCIFVKTAAVFVLKFHIVKWVHNGRLFWQMLCPRGLLAFPLFVVLGLMLITARVVLGYWPCT